MAFNFRLQPILHLREAERQRCRERLAEANRAEDLLRQQAEQLAIEIDDMLRRSRAGASASHVRVDNLLDVNRYRAVLQARRDVLQRQSHQLHEEVERRRLELMEADRQVRVLEKLRDRQHEASLAEDARREVRELDELVTQRWESDKE